MDGRPEKILGGLKPINAVSFKDQAYTLIRDAILSHQIKEGEIYSQDQLSAEFGISRTPVREALMQLQKEGYINFLRGRGFEVVSIRASDRDDIFEFRYIVEKAACGLAARRITGEQLRKLGEYIEAQERDAIDCDDRKFLAYDESFHYVIWEATNNQRLINVTAEMRNQLLRSGYEALASDREGRVKVIEEHRAIYEALRVGDAAAAAMAMETHLRKTYDRAISNKQHREGFLDILSKQ